MPWMLWVGWMWWQAAPPSAAVPTIAMPPGLEALGLLASVLAWFMWRHDAALSGVRQALDRNTRALTAALLMYHHAEAELAEMRRQVKGLQDELPPSGSVSPS